MGLRIERHQQHHQFPWVWFLFFASGAHSSFTRRIGGYRDEQQRLRDHASTRDNQDQGIDAQHSAAQHSICVAQNLSIYHGNYSSHCWHCHAARPAPLQEVLTPALASTRRIRHCTARHHRLASVAAIDPSRAVPTVLWRLGPVLRRNSALRRRKPPGDGPHTYPPQQLLQR